MSGERFHSCAVCGHRLPTSRMTRSKTTGRRFCADLRACDRRRVAARKAAERNRQAAQLAIGDEA